MTKRYELDVTEEAIARYIVTADSEEDAKAKLRRGVWDSWLDLGHGDPDIVDVRLLPEEAIR